MRLVIVLAVAAAVTIMLGVILVAVDVVMRLVTKEQPANMARLGLDLVAAGVAFGLVVLVVFAIARIGSSGGPGRSPGHGRAREQGHREQGYRERGYREQGQERLRAGAPPAGGGHGGGRSARPPVLNPTHVYSPGGLIDVPRDGRAPGTPGGQDIPEILRPHPPHPGYQPGMNPGGPSRGPYAPGGQPPPMPPREHVRSREAPRPAHGTPPREPMPPRGAAPSQSPQKPQAPRPGQAGPPRESRLLRDAGPPREGMGPGGPIRPGGPMPPRDPGYPASPGQGPGQGPRQGPGQAPGQGSGAGRPAGGPGYAAPGGYRPGPAGSPRPAEAAEQFDGGYAKVIRASDHPVRPPGPARPPSPRRLSDPGRAQDPARPVPPAEVYVYRDTEGLPGDLGSPAQGPDQNDPAYWYDLPGTGPAGSGAPGGPGGSSGPGGSGGSDGTGGAGAGYRHVLSETRGPFEPLVSSADPPGTTRRIAASTDALPIPGDPLPAPAHPAEPEPADGAGQPGAAQARKLEQIKDLYLTAEAIGETNVDKHFDQLLAQQRELISEYFKQSGVTRPADQAETEPGPPGPGDDSAPVAADQPRAW